MWSIPVGLGAKRVTIAIGGEMVSARPANRPRGDIDRGIATGTVDAYTYALIWRAVSSAGEHCFHTAGVTGSIPVPPTIKIKYLRQLQPYSAARVCSRSK